MKNFFKFFIHCFLLTLLVGCSTPTFPSQIGKPTNPAEIHSWYPPSEAQLQFRRENQKRLDAIRKKIQNLFLINENIRNEEEVIIASIRAFDPKLGSMEAQIKDKIKLVQLNFGKVEAELARAETLREDLKSAIIRFKNYKPPKKFSTDQYLKAIKLFKKGNYTKSIDHFQKILKRKPPRFLVDNIYFGIGSAYYKRNQMKEAAKYFEIITEKYSTGDKWPGSYLMLGLIYNFLNEKSKAIYLIENALEKNLTEQPRQILQRLLILIQDEDLKKEDQPDVNS